MCTPCGFGEFERIRKGWRDGACVCVEAFPALGTADADLVELVCDSSIFQRGVD